MRKHVLSQDDYTHEFRLNMLAPIGLPLFARFERGNFVRSTVDRYTPSDDQKD
jgi:hypothetical protein